MNEAFLHHVWQYQYFKKTGLCTCDGDPVAVFDPGNLNSDAGPDFTNARVRIGNMQWVGCVEIHIYASDWTDHHHQDDPAYDNVILHVVWENDVPVRRRNQCLLPTIELKGRVEDRLLLSYQRLVSSPQPIACSTWWQQVDPLLRIHMFERSLVQRLEAKADAVIRRWEGNRHDWEETCYQLLGINFGFKVNAEPFRQLVQSTPFRMLQKHGDKLQQMEALLFGQAGFLEAFFADEYFLLLKREYQVLRKKYSLEKQKLQVSQWKFLRLRPANFPTLRLAQFAALLHHRSNIFSGILAAETAHDLMHLFSVRQSDYWLRHYRFGEEKEETVHPPGEMSIYNLLINTVVPLLVAYGKVRSEQDRIDKAVSVLEHLPGEANAITRKYSSLGQKIGNAFDSQAVIELYHHFCTRKRCLECVIGNHLLNPVTTS